MTEVMIGRFFWERDDVRSLANVNLICLICQTNKTKTKTTNKENMIPIYSTKIPLETGKIWFTSTLSV